MILEPFAMYDAVQGIPDVRFIVAIMFGRTDLEFIKAVLEKSGYPFGSEETWTRQLREIHGEWLTKGKTLEGIRGYMGMVDPFNKLNVKPKKSTLIDYQFLYYLDGDRVATRDLERYRTKVIRAKDIESACEKFIKQKPKTLYQIDYEVKLKGDEFIDISTIPSVKDYL